MELLTQLSETLTTIIAFVIFFWAMKKFAWGPVITVLDERQMNIEQGFADIERKQAAADKLEQEYAGRLRDIETEARARIQEAIAEGRKAAAEINEKAREEAGQITERAKRNIELEFAKARHELRDEIVAISLQASERLLRERLDEPGQRRLVTSFIDELERRSQS